MDIYKEQNNGANREITNMKPVNNQSCYEYWLECTDMYGEYYAIQHFGKKIWKSDFLRDVDALAAYARIELGITKGDVVTVFMPTTVQRTIPSCGCRARSVIVWISVFMLFCPLFVYSLSLILPKSISHFPSEIAMGILAVNG